jgi:O-antigen/teichoic acid export membrane protein
LQDLFILVVGGIFLLRVFPGLRDRSLRAVSNPKELWKYSLALFGTSLFYKYTFNLDVLFLGRFGTAVEVGLYGLALKLQPFIFVPANAISEIFNPVVAELYARSDVKQIENVYKTVTKWTLTLSIPIFLVVALFHGQILSIFGKDFAGASTVLVILATANLLVNFVTMAGHVINMIGRPNVNFVNAILTAVINVGLYLLLIPSYGMLGAALAYSTGLLLINTLRTVQVWRFLGILPFKRSLVKVIAAAAASILGTYAVQWEFPAIESAGLLLLVPMVLLCWGIYAGCLILLKFDDEDRMILDALAKRLRLRRNRK